MVTNNPNHDYFLKSCMSCQMAFANISLHFKKSTSMVVWVLRVTENFFYTLSFIFIFLLSVVVLVLFFFTTTFLARHYNNSKFTSKTLIYDESSEKPSKSRRWLRNESEISRLTCKENMFWLVYTFINHKCNFDHDSYMNICCINMHR